MRRYGVQQDNNNKQQQYFIRLQVTLNPLAPQVAVLSNRGGPESTHLKLHMNKNK